MSAVEPFRFGTKAETLEALRARGVSVAILPSVTFTAGQWRDAPNPWVAAVQSAFDSDTVVVRSSALAEDSGDASMAGAFESVIGVLRSDSTALSDAIERVLASYAGNPSDQVLVQPMLEGVAVSGVITTRTLAAGAPYIVVNYDDQSGRTDTVTGGTGVSKTVFVAHGARAEDMDSGRLRRWVAMAREVQAACAGAEVDLEFAELEDGVLVLLQARRIAASVHWDRLATRHVPAVVEALCVWTELGRTASPGLAGARTCWGQMPDWNPAEMLGAHPRPLALSLYRELITRDVWQQARASMGYRPLAGQELMATLAGRPFIDVRASFNSFLPAGLDGAIAEPLVNAWVEHLAAHPELHDKVEFEVATTSRDFQVRTPVEEFAGDALSAAARTEWIGALATLTRNAIDLGETGSLARATSACGRLWERLDSERGHAPPALGPGLARCRDLGTRPFAVAARHAFIAEALLRSAVVRGALTPERLAAFRAGVETVSGELSSAVRNVAQGGLDASEFMGRYGHLRPSTYDILSARYDARPGLLDNAVAPPRTPSQPFAPTAAELSALTQLAKEAELAPHTGADILAYATKAIVAREWCKFVFTRQLSELMEQLVVWGDAQGVDRGVLSWLRIPDLLDIHWSPSLEGPLGRMERLATEARYEYERFAPVRLSYLVRDARDLRVVPMHRAAANFVTDRRVVARTVHVEPQATEVADLYGAVVCINSADPGFDWVFSRGIAGLVTEFGGTNSHMAIRCAEYGLPAAIGCGSLTFESVVAAGMVELDCAAETVRPSGPAEASA